jgi:hypothetical protein
LYYRLWTSLVENNFGILIATKVDENKVALVKPKNIAYHRKKNIEIYYISTKAGYNL